MKQQTKKTLLFLGSTHFLIHVFSQLLPAMIPVLRGELGLTLGEASLLVSVPLLVQVAFYLPAGAASDRNGAAVLALSFLVTAVGALIVPAASCYIHLMAAFTLFSLGSTLYHPPALKATSEVSEESLGLAMGVQNAGGSLGYSAGPILLGLTLPVLGWRAAFYVWVPFILAAAAYSYLHASRIGVGGGGGTDWGKLREVLGGGLVTVIIAGAFTDLTFVNVSTYVTTYLTETLGAPAGLSSIIFGVGPLAGMLGSVAGGALGDRYGRRVSFLVVCVGMAAAVGFIPYAPSLALSSALYIAWRCLYSASMPLVNSLITESSAAESRSLCFAAYSMTSNVLGAAAPVLTAGVVEALGVDMVFLLSVVTLIPSILLVGLRKTN